MATTTTTTTKTATKTATPRKKAAPKKPKLPTDEWSSATAGAAAVAAELNKEYGAGTIVLASQIRDDISRRITTGSDWFDWTLGRGWTTNQWHEVIGESSSGKTTVVLKAVAANQALDPNFVVIWCAAESLDKHYAHALGVDLDRFVIIPRNEMEIVLQMVLKFARSQAADMIVVDSLPALVPLAENERDMDEDSVALAARTLGQFFRKNGWAMRRSLLESSRGCTGILINQYREKIGVMYGDNRSSPGGRAKEFFCATRTEIRRGDFITDDERKLVISRHNEKHTIRREVVVGQEVLIRNQKNKTATPYREGMLDFYFASGVVGGVEFQLGDYDPAREIVLLARGLGLLAYSGKWRDAEGLYEWRNEEEMMHSITTDERLLIHVAEMVRKRA